MIAYNTATNCYVRIVSFLIMCMFYRRLVCLFIAIVTIFLGKPAGILFCRVIFRVRVGISILFRIGTVFGWLFAITGL